MYRVERIVWDPSRLKLRTFREELIERPTAELLYQATEAGAAYVHPGFAAPDSIKDELKNLFAVGLYKEVDNRWYLEQWRAATWAADGIFASWLPYCGSHVGTPVPYCHTDNLMKVCLEHAPGWKILGPEYAQYVVVLSIRPPAPFGHLVPTQPMTFKMTKEKANALQEAIQALVQEPEPQACREPEPEKPKLGPCPICNETNARMTTGDKLNGEVVEKIPMIECQDCGCCLKGDANYILTLWNTHSTPGTQSSHSVYAKIRK